MAFTIFSNSTTADANEVMGNFALIAKGDRLPRGGANLDPTTSVYNIGSSTYKWNYIYCDNLNFTGTITTDQTWTLISSQTITAPSTRIEFTGLNGDVDKMYKLIMTNPNVYIYITMNGVSAASSYSWDGVRYSSAFDTSTSGLTGGIYAQKEFAGILNAPNYCEILISADSGYNKPVMCKFKTLFGYTLGENGFTYGVMTDTSTITSIQLHGTVYVTATTMIYLYRLANV